MKYNNQIEDLCLRLENSNAAHKKFSTIVGELLSDNNRVSGFYGRYHTVHEHGENNLAKSMPDAWMDILSVSGSVQDCAESVRRFIAAGVDALVFVLPFVDEREQIERLAKDLLPLFR